MMLYDIRLEDNFEDVLGKAAGGLGIGNPELAQRSGLEVEQVSSLLDGDFDAEKAAALAEALGLHGPSLVELGKQAWKPQAVETPGLLGFNTPHPVPGYEEMTVNSYIAFDPDSREAVVFDSGADASPMLAAIEGQELKVMLVLLTHAHDDHIKDLDKLVEAAGKPPVWINGREAIPQASSFDAGKSFEAGRLRISTRLTNGHSPGGTTFVIEGLERPVAVVGDSLFCCSMGGARGSYGLALDNNRKHILSLPNETVLCPGHGPMSSVAGEKAHNSFFPEFKQ